MTKTIKQQLIYLSYQGASYPLSWQYFNCFLHHYQTTDTLSSFECQELLNETILLYPKLKNSEINFISKTINPDLLESLTQQSFMIGDSIYPSLWLELPQPPLVIYFEGHLACLAQPLVSIVGTRQISHYGYEMTSLMATAIAAKGWGSVSGLALGVDKAAHEAATKVRHRATIGIIANGTDHYYPKANSYLQQKMAEEHLILSEYLPHTRAQRHHFIMRNRLVAGISSATIVMEAATKSGSLITANYAVQSNREVFALPGRINDTHSMGCNELIQSGAHPILSIADTIDQLNAHFAFQHIVKP